MSLRYPRRAGMLLKTGQTTQHNSELDDGYYEQGLAKRYDVLTVGQYNGNRNIDLIHLTAATIAFAATTPGAITDSGLGLAIFQTGDIIVITGSVSNDGVYTISEGGVAGTIRATEPTLLELAGATVNIAKREAHSNNCVLDNNTGLMWSRYAGDKMGIASDGAMLWTGQLYDIFQYVAQANAALLGGYADWRAPNLIEFLSLVDISINAPDAVAFPAFESNIYYWTSSTRFNVTANAWRFRVSDMTCGAATKTTTHVKVLLARGG